MAQALAAEQEAHEHALRQLRAEAAAARAKAASAPQQSTTTAAAAAALRRAEAAEGRAANSSIAERSALVRACSCVRGNVRHFNSLETALC
jgi:hypothetical protein